MDANANTKTMKTVFTVVERGQGKSFWQRIGIGFVNKDGSINLKLDAIPINGSIQVRDWEEARSDAHGGPGSPPRGARRENASPSPMDVERNRDFGALG